MKLKRLLDPGLGFTGLQVAALDADTSKVVWKACRLTPGVPVGASPEGR